MDAGENASLGSRNSCRVRCGGRLYVPTSTCARCSTTLPPCPRPLCHSGTHPRTQALVQEALDATMRGRTVLVIAHRLSTVRQADQILVLQDGRVVEQGRHDELLARSGLYTELYRTQFEQSPAEVEVALAVD